MTMPNRKEMNTQIHIKIPTFVVSQYEIMSFASIINYYSVFCIQVLKTFLKMKDDVMMTMPKG